VPELARALALRFSILLPLVLGVNPAMAEGRCIVADPSGTPLNVRTNPNGRIVSTLPNGLEVHIREIASLQGKTWARVSPGNEGATIGWVVRSYLDCDRTSSSKRIPGYAFAYHDETAHASPSLEDCIASCRRAANCSAYVFFISKRLCRLMTRSDAVLEPNSDAISGYNGAGSSTATALPPPPSDRSDVGQSSRIVIPLRNENGIFVVPVEINSKITLDFVIDSGASDVSVPADVVSVLIRTGTIRSSDFIGQQTYILADGTEVPSPVFTIRSLKVGGHIVENVRGSIASPKATLLLGQSFLRHFRSWSIDNAKHALVLE
jgi:clan AA aspartic protease (TIGR02281 family)